MLHHRFQRSILTLMVSNGAACNDLRLTRERSAIKVAAHCLMPGIKCADAGMAGCNTGGMAMLRNNRCMSDLDRPKMNERRLSPSVQNCGNTGPSLSVCRPLGLEQNKEASLSLRHEKARHLMHVLKIDVIRKSGEARSQGSFFGWNALPLIYRAVPSLLQLLALPAVF